MNFLISWYVFCGLLTSIQRCTSKNKNLRSWANPCGRNKVLILLFLNNINLYVYYRNNTKFAKFPEIIPICVTSARKWSFLVPSAWKSYFERWLLENDFVERPEHEYIFELRYISVVRNFCCNLSSQGPLDLRPDISCAIRSSIARLAH